MVAVETLIDGSYGSSTIAFVREKKNLLVIFFTLEGLNEFLQPYIFRNALSPCMGGSKVLPCTTILNSLHFYTYMYARKLSYLKQIMYKLNLH